MIWSRRKVCFAQIPCWAQRWQVQDTQPGTLGRGWRHSPAPLQLWPRERGTNPHHSQNLHCSTFVWFSQDQNKDIKYAFITETKGAVIRVWVMIPEQAGHHIHTEQHLCSGYGTTPVQPQTGTRSLNSSSNPLPSLPATLSCFAVFLSLLLFSLPSGVPPFFCVSLLKNTTKTNLSFLTENLLFPHHFILPPHNKPEHCSSSFVIDWGHSAACTKEPEFGQIQPKTHLSDNLNVISAPLQT